MKKIISGVGLILSSVILYGLTHLSAAMLFAAPAGNAFFRTALYRTNGVIPMIISIGMGIMGIYLIVAGNKEL